MSVAIEGEKLVFRSRYQGVKEVQVSVRFPLGAYTQLKKWAAEDPIKRPFSNLLVDFFSARYSRSREIPPMPNVMNRAYSIINEYLWWDKKRYQDRPHTDIRFEISVRTHRNISVAAALRNLRFQDEIRASLEFALQGARYPK